MNRLLTILLLLGATAHGQIDNPPTTFPLPATFSTNVTVTGTATFATNVSVAGILSVGSLNTATPATWALDAVQTNSSGPSSFTLTLPDNGNVVRVTNAFAIRNIANGRLGAFYYVVNQSGSSFAIENTNGITVQGGKSLTLANNEVATLVATGPTNVSVANRGDLNNVTLTGVDNLATQQTASSGASLMTRDLVDARLGNPESTFNTTYWFGLEGLGNWITAGTGVTTAPTAGGGAGISTTLTFWTTARIGTNHAGVAIQSPPDNIAGGNMWRPSDGNNVTFRLRIRKGSTISHPAFAFMLGNRLQSSIWAVGAYGLFYVAQPTNSWVSNAVVTQHSRIAVSNVVWAVNTAGTNGATEPTWTDLIGSLVTNGSAVYINAGPHTSNNWVLALGHTNASQVVMTNTGKSAWPTNNRADLTLKLRGVQSSSPYTIFASVQDGTGESAEVSLSHSNNNPLGPQMWQRWDGPGAVADGETVSIRYIGIQGTLPPLL